MKHGLVIAAALLTFGACASAPPSDASAPAAGGSSASSEERAAPDEVADEDGGEAAEASGLSQEDEALLAEMLALQTTLVGLLETHGADPERAAVELNAAIDASAPEGDLAARMTALGQRLKENPSSVMSWFKAHQAELQALGQRAAALQTKYPGLLQDERILDAFARVNAEF